MATTYGPEPVHDASALHAMTDHSFNPLGGIDNSAVTSQDSLQASPPPIPSFTFPARPVDSSPTNDQVPPRRSGRRPMSAIEPVTESYQLSSGIPNSPVAGRTALPSFSFNPGASLPPAPLESPHNEFVPISPQLPKTIPPKPRHGHRRGGSEFVGGRLREGNSIAVMSGSPTKQELALGSSSLAPPRKSHRRGTSTALSTNDLSLLAPPNDFSLKGSSAPNSPTNFEHFHMPMTFPFPPAPEPEVAAEQAKEDNVVESLPANSLDLAETPGTPEQKPASKARVGFSDTLEFIPRPLSLVSTDTSSTVTARPSHNVSGSISSLVPAASPDRRESPSPSLSRSPSRNTIDSRPSTAGAILDRVPPTASASNTSLPRRNSIPALLDLSDATDITPSTPSPSKTSKRWSFFGLDSFSNHNPSPTKQRPHSSSSGDSVIEAVSGCSSSDHESESTIEPNEPQQTSEKKVGKKDKTKRRKKVKGWAGAILPRKQKGTEEKRAKYDVRPPTPPASVVPADEDDEEDDNGPAPLKPLLTLNDLPPSPPPASSSPKMEEVSSPMIDLDAALGPFNTPLPHNPEWEAAQRAAGNNGKRRLHSAQGMRGFTGPGMHYHRRAESAPDLPPFDAARAGIPRFGSSSTMADVFEEDEEDEGGAKPQSQTGGKAQLSEDSSGEATPPAIVKSDPVQDAVPAVRRKSSGLTNSEFNSAESIRSQRSRTSLLDSPIAEASPVFRFTPRNRAPSEPSCSPRMVSGSTMSGREPPPELSFPQGSPLAGGVAGSPRMGTFPPAAPRSPVSADAQRLSTAPSSVHEENSFQSLLLGEPGPEVRLSVDYDIPSLTSSTSTTTRESCFVPQTRMSQPALREPRPLSVSSTTFGRRRSSLASLSRLISSSHGERSKLSMEVTLDNEADNKKARGGKAKRFGKLMQFWKPSKGADASANRS